MPTVIRLTVVLLILSSCMSDTKSTIRFDLGNLEIEQVIVGSIVEGIHSLVELDDGKGRLDISITMPTILMVKLSPEGEHSHVDDFFFYMVPGETIDIEPSPEDSIRLIVSGPSFKENQILNEYSRLSALADKKFDMYEMSAVEPIQFLDSLELKFAELETLIVESRNSENVNRNFADKIAKRLAFYKANHLNNYEEFYNYHNDSEPTIPVGFYDPLKIVELDDANLMIFQEGKDFAMSEVFRDVNRNDFESVAAFIDALLIKIDTLFSDPATHDYMSLSQLIQLLNHVRDLEAIEDQITSFQESTDNQYVLKSLDYVIEPWLQLKKGNIAPDFTGVTIDGNILSKADFEGKNVYLDFWATWCRPCIAEIPALRELEAEFGEGNIEFISISLDRPDTKEKWLEFVTGKDMPGIQIHSKESWESDMVAEYNIKGLPRYVLIDARGELISANAPRPSDKKLRELLLEIGI